MKNSLKIRYAVLFFILFIFIAFNSNIPDWSSASNILKPVRAGNTASYSKNNNGYLIIASGRDQNDAILKTVQRYNVNSDSWDTLNPHPTGLLGAATAIIEDSLYLIGGVVNPPGSGQNIVYKLSINENIWSTVNNSPLPLVDAKAVSYQDSLIYTAGGVGGPVEGKVYLYNSKSDSWRIATSFPCLGNRNFGGFAITGDTLIYMCGTSTFGSSVYFDSVYVGVIDQSDRAVIHWTRGENFPGSTRTFFDAASWGDNGIIMTGGSTDNTFNSPSNECYSFSPGRNEWTKLPDKPTQWLTGQSGSVHLPNNIWKLICASGYDSGYLVQTEILTDTLITVGINNFNTQLPESLELSQNVPNPFNPETTINYSLFNNGFVSLKIYDIQGKEIESLINENQTRGDYTVRFNGGGKSSGIYFYTLSQEDFSVTKKMLLLK